MIHQKPRKGVLAKGVSAEPSVTPRKTKQELPKDIGPGRTFGTQSATVKRGVHVCKNLQKKFPRS